MQGNARGMQGNAGECRNGAYLRTFSTTCDVAKPKHFHDGEVRGFSLHAKDFFRRLVGDHWLVYVDHVYLFAHFFDSLFKYTTKMSELSGGLLSGLSEKNFTRTCLLTDTKTKRYKKFKLKKPAPYLS